MGNGGGGRRAREAQLPLHQADLDATDTMSADASQEVGRSKSSPPLTKPSWRSGSGVAAGCTVLLCVGVVCRFLIELVEAFKTQTVTEFGKALVSSAWVQATLADYVAGAMFASAWIATHPAPRVWGLPHLVWAVAMPGLGNPVLYTYIALAVYDARDIRAVFSPPGDRREIGSASRIDRIVRVVAAVHFATTASLYFLFLTKALAVEDVIVGYHALKEEPLVFATFLDNLMGIVFAAVVIAFREGASLNAVAWLVALFLAGHGVACLYGLIVVFDAWRWDVGVGTAFAHNAWTQRSAYI